MNRVMLLTAVVFLLGLPVSGIAVEDVALPQKKLQTKAPAQPAAGHSKQLPQAPAGGLRQTGPVDLVVSDLFIASGEVRFKVRNAGLSEKKPGRVNYRLTVTRYAISPADSVVSRRSYSGVAALTSLSRLRPYQTTGEDRVTGQRLSLSENMRLELCINPERAVIEGNYGNNCLSRKSQQILPDLAIERGSLNLYEPRKKDPWYKKVGDFLWDVVTGFEFDPSGLGPQDHVALTIINRGGVAVTGFDVTVGVWRPGQSGNTYRWTFSQRLEPGERRNLAVTAVP